MFRLSDKGWLRLAILTGALLVITNLVMNVGEEYLRERFEGMRRKAYFENVISRKGLSLKEARHWRSVEDRENQEAPVIK